jgi:hypothetical protein
MKPSVRRLWAAAEIRLSAEPLMLISLPPGALAAAADLVSSAEGSFAALILEEDEVSITIPETAWESRKDSVRPNAEDGPFRAITIGLNLDLEVSGFLAPAAERLAAAEIPIVPQCAFLKDHILVRDLDADRAKAILEEWVRECREAE